MGIYDKIFKPKKLVLSDGKVVEEKRTRTPLVLLLLLIATVISVRITGFSLNTILTRGNVRRRAVCAWNLRGTAA